MESSTGEDLHGGRWQRYARIFASGARPHVAPRDNGWFNRVGVSARAIHRRRYLHSVRADSSR